MLKETVLFVLLCLTIRIADANGSNSNCTPIVPCAGANLHGTLTAHQPANGISATVLYSNGDGTAYSAETVTSVGVTGLTATRSSGHYKPGDCYVVYSISGTPNGSG